MGRLDKLNDMMYECNKLLGAITNVKSLQENHSNYMGFLKKVSSFMKKNENTAKMKSAVIVPIMQELDYQGLKGSRSSSRSVPSWAPPSSRRKTTTMSKKLLDDIYENLSKLFKIEMKKTRYKQNLSVAKTLHDRLSSASSVVPMNVEAGVIEGISRHMSRIPHTQRTMERMVEGSRKKSRASRKKKTRQKKRRKR